MGGMGMGGMNQMGGMGMGGMNQMGGMMRMRYARVNLRPGAVRTGMTTGMTHVRVGANGPIAPRPQPTMVDWRRTVRLHQPISIKWLEGQR